MINLLRLGYLSALCHFRVSSATFCRLAQSHSEGANNLFETNSASDFETALCVTAARTSRMHRASRNTFCNPRHLLKDSLDLHILLQKLACRLPACKNKHLFQTLCSRYVTNRTPAVYLPKGNHPFDTYHDETSIVDDELGCCVQAVLQPSTSMPEGTATIRGWDFNDGVDLTGIMNSMLRTGCQASALGQACNEVNRMVSPWLRELLTH